MNAPMREKPASMPVRAPHAGIGFVEFVTLMAGFMAVNGLAIDSMLPALPQIGASLGIAEENHRQWVVTAYLLGFGGFQIVYGPLSDRFGRKPVLLIGIAIYAVFSMASALAPSLGWMLAARAIQGAGAASSRVLVIAIIRDCYEGRQMARVTSLTFIVFLAVPILAPTLGQLIMHAGSWRLIFGALTVLSTLLLVWGGLRLPETLHPEDRLPLRFDRIVEAFRIVLSNRIAVGYMLAMTLVIGGLFGFINSAQQVVGDVFGEPERVGVVFALIGSFMAIASFANSRIVGRLGTRRVSHTAIFGYVGFALINLITAWTGHQTLWSFALLQALTMFCFGLTGPNFGAMAMEPVGRVAGTASSVQGFVTTVGGALLGFAIGQHFDGSAVPMLAGFAVLGSLAIVILIFTEGRLFQPHHPTPQG